MGSLGAIYAGGSSSIATLPQFLTSIGKDSFYARFYQGIGMYVNADKTGGAVALNGTVGSWEADPANTSNFTAYWTQSTTGDRPHYATANGINSLYSSSNNPSGAADQRHLILSSTTALNGNYSLLMRLPILARDNRTPYSHNGTQVYFGTSTGGGSLFSAVAAGGSTAADQVTHCVRNVAGTTSGNAIVCISQTGTGHNNTAPNLLKRSTAYSSSAISELWFTPLLTIAELDAAMTFIT
jgi:hypothetical protein